MIDDGKVEERKGWSDGWMITNVHVVKAEMMRLCVLGSDGFVRWCSDGECLPCKGLMCDSCFPVHVLMNEFPAH